MPGWEQSTGGDRNLEPVIVYRALAEEDSIRLENGFPISAKAPDGIWTAAEHVSNASSDPLLTGRASKNSPWISTSRIYDVAEGYNSGNGIAIIDLNKVNSFKTEVWRHAPRVNGELGLPYHRSIWAQEVTIYLEIPKSAIIEVEK